MSNNSKSNNKDKTQPIIDIANSTINSITKLNEEGRSKRIEADKLRHLISKKKLQYNQEIRKYSLLLKKVIQAEEKIEEINKKISKIKTNQILFYSTLNQDLYSHLIDITSQKTKLPIFNSFLSFCGFSKAQNEENIFHTVLTNELELKYLIEYSNIFQISLYKSNREQFNIIKNDINKVISSIEFPFPFDIISDNIKNIYLEIELMEQKEQIEISLSELQKQKNLNFIGLKQLEVNCSLDQNKYKELKTEIDGIKIMLEKYQTIKKNNQFGNFMKFTNTAKEFMNINWKKGDMEQKDISASSFINITNENYNLTGSSITQNDYNVNMNMQSEISEDISEISSIYGSSIIRMKKDCKNRKNERKENYIEKNRKRLKKRRTKSALNQPFYTKEKNKEMIINKNISQPFISRNIKRRSFNINNKGDNKSKSYTNMDIDIFKNNILFPTMKEEFKIYRSKSNGDLLRYNLLTPMNKMILFSKQNMPITSNSGKNIFMKMSYLSNIKSQKHILFNGRKLDNTPEILSDRILKKNKSNTSIVKVEEDYSICDEVSPNNKEQMNIGKVVIKRLFSPKDYHSPNEVRKKRKANTMQTLKLETQVNSEGCCISCT